MKKQLFNFFTGLGVKKLRNKNEKGFTLIELLVVIAIIALLASVVLVALNNARTKSRDAKRLADVTQLGTAMELYLNHCSSYPVNIATVINNTFILSLGTGATCGNNKRTAAADGGIAITASGNVLLGQFPTAPLPVDGTCTAAQNSYTFTSYTDSTCATAVVAGNLAATVAAPCYHLDFCLGAATGGFSDTNADGRVVGTVSPTGITAQ